MFSRLVANYVRNLVSAITTTIFSHYLALYSFEQYNYCSTL